jgi:phenylacetate-CoA ligase
MTFYGRLYRNVLFPAFDVFIKRRRTTHYWRQAELTQWHTPSQLAAQQLEDVRAIVSYAFEHCEYYRSRWTQLGLNVAALQTLDDLQRWPIVTRDDVRCHRLAMQSKPAGKRLTKSTGGSTGEPLVFDLDLESNERRTAMTYRGYDWAGGGPGSRRMLIWGVDLKQSSLWRRFKVELHHRFDHERVINCFDMSRASMPLHFESMQRFRPEVIIAYTNAIYEFARFLDEHALVPTHVRSIIVGAEKLYSFQRALIEKVFQAPVFETYGSREFMLIGAECDRHEGLHLSMENLLVEVLDEDGGRTADGSEGDVVITDLFNRAMPFIRYRNGDRAIAGWTQCSCGRGLPLLRQVVGRHLDVVRTPSDKLIPGEYFPHLFKDFPVVRRFQILQQRIDEIEIRIVVEPDWNDEIRQAIQSRMQSTLGNDLAIRWHQVDEIPLSKSGKLQVVVSEVRKS